MLRLSTKVFQKRKIPEMTEQEKILEELKKNLGEERLDEIMDSVRSFFSGPGRGARPAQTSSELKRDQQLATVARNPATARVAQDIGLSGIEPKSVTKADPGIASTQATSNRGRFNPGQAARREMETDPQSYNQTLRSLQGDAALKPGEGGLAKNRAQQTQTSTTAATLAANRSNTPENKTVPTGISSTAQDERDMGAPKFSGAPTPPPRPAPSSTARPAATTSSTPAAPSAPAQPSRSSQMFQTYSDKGDDATSADFFRADRQAQAGRKAAPAAKQAPAAPQKPQQSNADYMKSSGMMDEANLERKIRKMFEQKSAKFTGGGADIQDLSGPNKPVGKSEKEQHHGTFEEESIQEIVGTATEFGGKHARRRRSQAKTTLGGEGLQQRSSMIRSGNQKAAGRYEEYTISEARKASFKKVEKMKRNRTDTGSFADPIDTEPSKPSMTGY